MKNHLLSNINLETNLVDLIKDDTTLGNDKTVKLKDTGLENLNLLQVEGGVNFTQYHATKKALEIAKQERLNKKP